MRSSVGRLVAGIALAFVVPLGAATAAAGPPFPQPVPGQAVYDGRLAGEARDAGRGLYLRMAP